MSTWYKILPLSLLIVGFGVGLYAGHFVSTTYKTELFGGQIPANWSLMTDGNNIAKTINDTVLPQDMIESFAPDKLVFTDWSSSQVNIIAVTAGLEQEMAADARSSGYVVSTTTIQGLPAVVITYPMEKDGYPSIDKPGGKDYFIKVSGYSNGVDYLLIRQPFENPTVVERFLNTANFVK